MEGLVSGKDHVTPADNGGWKTNRKVCRLLNLLKLFVVRNLRLATLGEC